VVRYKVRQGDTVLSVADEWGVAPEMVRKWNKLRGNDLRRGRILLIHRPVTDTARVSGGSTKRSSSRKSSIGKGLQASGKASAKRVTHTVKKGETLSSIASRYNTSVTALRRDNSRAAAHLKPGDVLIISSVR
jgi:membrane-bound lytic murein transglycosylase D